MVMDHKLYGYWSITYKLILTVIRLFIIKFDDQAFDFRPEIILDYEYI